VFYSNFVLKIFDL